MSKHFSALIELFRTLEGLSDDVDRSLMSVVDARRADFPVPASTYRNVASSISRLIRVFRILGPEDQPIRLLGFDDEQQDEVAECLALVRSACVEIAREIEQTREVSDRHIDQWIQAGRQLDLALEPFAPLLLKRAGKTADNGELADEAVGKAPSEKKALPTEEEADNVTNIADQQTICKQLRPSSVHTGAPPQTDAEIPSEIEEDSLYPLLILAVGDFYSREQSESKTNGKAIAKAAGVLYSGHVKEKLAALRKMGIFAAGHGYPLSEKGRNIYGSLRDRKKSS
ncbi:hypothetical protein HQ520_06635 [bacterium]|nr:hypothetical protein [bacterium]